MSKSLEQTAASSFVSGFASLAAGLVPIAAPSRDGALASSLPPESIESSGELSAVSTRRAEPERPSGDRIAVNFKSALRSQTSLLAPLERVCLQRLAERMPKWVMPDHLTLLGLAAMLAAGACYAFARWWAPALLLVNFWLAVNWFGDSLDGTLARFRDKQRPRYGFYVDHMVDAFGTLFITCGMALSGYMSWTVALIGLVAYSMLSINVYLATYTVGTFKLSFYKLSPTELRILLAVGNAVALFRPTTHILGEPYKFYDVAAIVAVVLIGLVTVVSVVQNTIKLYDAERV